MPGKDIADDGNLDLDMKSGLENTAPLDNQPKGEKAVKLKKKFLDTFSENISRIEREHKGYRKHVYGKHYGPLMVKLLRYGDLKLAVTTYFREAYKGGFMFWLEFVYQIILVLKKHTTNRQGNQS